MIQLPFIHNKVYHRINEVHKIYGGNWRSGICPSSTNPYIFIFSGERGQKYGYIDGWINDEEFSYSGHGQVGDMKFTGFNSALRDHLRNDKRVFLFENERVHHVKFISELEFLDLDFFPTDDANGKSRTGIKFRFRRVGSHLTSQLELLKPDVSEYIEKYKKLHINIDGIVNSKVGQGDYLKGIVRRWQYKCAVTGLDKLNLLFASNIEPWPEDDQPKRQDIDNGILLSPAYDVLFEKHLISFEDSGKIILSKNVEKSTFHQLGVTGRESINDLNDYNKIYLDKHRSRFDEAH